MRSRVLQGFAIKLMLPAGALTVNGMLLRVAGQGLGEGGTGFSYQSSGERHKIKNLEFRIQELESEKKRRHSDSWILYSVFNILVFNQSSG